MAKVEAESRLWRDEETLRRLYWDEGLSMQQIADKLGCTNQTITYWMKRHDIDRRDIWEAHIADDNINPDEHVAISIRADTRATARTIKQDLGLTWDELLQRAIEELDPDNDNDD